MRSGGACLTFLKFKKEYHYDCKTIWKEWIPESEVEKPEEADFFFERYGEEFDPQTGTGDIEIWLPVKLKD